MKPSANLSKLEEVLVVTKIDERQATPDQAGPVRAADVLAERLPERAAKACRASRCGATGTAQPGAAAGQASAAEAQGYGDRRQSFGSGSCSCAKR